MKTASELLLSSATDGVDLRTVDPETQARLEALLEAAGKMTSTELALRLLRLDILDLTGLSVTSWPHPFCIIYP